MSPENGIKWKFVKMRLMENRENAVKWKIMKNAKSCENGFISVVSIEQRLRKCRFRTFQGEFTQKVVKTRKV